MMKLYFAPRTRAVRIAWLLEELGLPYELERVEFLPPSDNFYQQRTPTGKLPTLVDGDLVMCESGAIAEYILETYAGGRLAPATGTPGRAHYLQWLHWADSTAFPPIGILVWLLVYRQDADRHPELIADAQARAGVGLAYLEREIGAGEWLLGDTFTAADIMVGFTLVAAQTLGVLTPDYPRVQAYLARLQQRPAFKKAAAM